MGFVDSLRRLIGLGDAAPIISDPSLDQLHEGYLLDYNVKTWEVTRHTITEYEGCTIDTWTLRHHADTLRLEHIVDPKRDDFRLSEPVEMSEVSADGTPVLGVVREDEPPDTVRYQDREYALTEAYTRVEEKEPTFGRSQSDQWVAGLWGGIGAYLNVNANGLRIGFLLVTVLLMGTESILCLGGPLAYLAYILVAGLLPVQSHSPAEDESNRHVFHDWVYEHGDHVLTLEYDPDGWAAYAGRPVDSYEFDNILPRSSD